MTADNWAKEFVKWQRYGSRTCWGPAIAGSRHLQTLDISIPDFYLGGVFEHSVAPRPMLLAFFCAVLCVGEMFYLNYLSWHWRLTDWEIHKLTNVVFLWNSGRAGSKTCLSYHFNIDVTWLVLKCSSNYSHLWGKAINSSYLLLIWLQCT